jgi:hypothetical protein
MICLNRQNLETSLDENQTKLFEIRLRCGRIKPLQPLTGVRRIIIVKAVSLLLELEIIKRIVRVYYYAFLRACLGRGSC